ncbi:MAG: hypothetical protein VX877_04850 [Planctomycetota bacterium]|nr:hypothetical protein [Planctomycetota bacterium]
MALPTSIGTNVIRRMHVAGGITGGHRRRDTELFRRFRPPANQPALPNGPGTDCTGIAAATFCLPGTTFLATPPPDYPAANKREHDQPNCPLAAHTLAS